MSMAMPFPWMDPAGFGAWIGTRLGMIIGGADPTEVVTPYLPPWLTLPLKAAPIVAPYIAPAIAPYLAPTFQPVIDWLMAYGPYIVAGIVGILVIIFVLYFGKDIIIKKALNWAKEELL